MKIVAISDTHGLLPSNLPAGDVLCICGDIVPMCIQRSTKDSRLWMEEVFMPWVTSSPYQHVLLVPGNHDFALQRIEPGEFETSKFHILIDKSIEINGKVFYGMPWCPVLKNWAFYAPDHIMSGICDRIPDGDVLIVHCPPKFGTQGVVLQKDNYNYLKDFGNPILTEKLIQLSYKWVLSGHIHTGNHEVEMLNNTNCVNVSMRDEDYQVKYKPFVFEL